jgi:autotransporter-associated beta strand protein
VTVWQNLGSLTLGNLSFANADTLITNNTITLNGGGTSVITVGGTGTTANVSVELSGTSGSLVKEGSGTLRLNRYAYGLSGLTINGGMVYCGFQGNSDGLNVGNGTITVNSGAVLKYGGPNQINNSAVIDVKSGGLFDAINTTDNIGAFTGDGVVTNASSLFVLWPNGIARTFSGLIYGTPVFEPRQPGPLVAGRSNAFQNVWFNLYLPGTLAFAPGVGRFELGGLSTTNDQILALQDTEGGAITLALGNRNTDITLRASLTGPGGLEKTGTATLALTNAHGYAGPTTVSGGTLRLGDGVRDGALTNSASITVLAGKTLAFNTAANQTYANPVFGAGSLTKAGAGSLSLNDFQMRPGTVSVSGGTLALNGGNSSGVTFTVNSGGALQVNGGSGRMYGFTLSTGSSPLVFNGGNNTITTLVANAGTAVEVNGGTHQFYCPLGGNGKINRYMQTGGTATFDNSQGMGNTNVIHAFVSGGTLNIGTTQPPRGLGLLASGNAVVKMAATQRIASDGTGHSLIITNNADVTQSQTLQFMSVGATASTGIVALAGGTLTVGGLGNGEANAISPVFVFFNGGLLKFSASTTVAANPNTTFRVMEGGARIDGGSLQTQINQPLVNGAGGGADGGLTKYGASVLVLITNATYAGQTTVKSGTLRTTSSGGSPFGGGDILLDGGILQFNPAGSGLTVGLTAADGIAGNTFTYRPGPSILGLSKGGNSSVTLTLGNSGAAAESVLARTNRSVLALIPSAGTAMLGSTEKLLVNGGVTLVNGMASASLFGVHNSDDRLPCDFLTYGVNGFQAASYTAGLGGGSTSLANVTTNSVANDAQVYALRVAPGKTLTINSGQTVTVGDGVNPAGVIINNASGSRAAITNGTLNFGTSEGIVIFNQRFQSTTGPLLSSVITGSNGLTLAGGGTDEDLVLGSAGNTYTGGTRIMSGRISIANAQGFSSGDVYIYGNAGAGGQFLFNFVGTLANALHLAGVGTAEAAPVGAVRFDANSTLSGPVELMDDARVGVPTPTVTGTISGSIYGLFGLEIGCPGQAWGKILLNGNNTYSGTTRVSGGTLEIGASGTLGTGPVINNTTLVFSNTGNLTVTNPISGTGRVLKNGNGTLTLSGAVSYSGATDVNAGTLVIGNASFGGSALGLSGTLDLGGQSLSVGRLGGGGTVSNSVGGAVTVTVGAGNANSLYWGAIRDGAGTTALSKTGTGTLTLSGLNTYSGATVINAGTVKLQGVQTAAPTNGLSYRLDAADASKLTLSGSNVAVWADSTATGANFTQSLAHLQPVYVTNAINGLAAVRFNGWVTNRMVAAKSVQAQTVFIVNKMTDYMGLAGLWGYAANDTGIRAQSATNWQLTGDQNDFTQGGEMYINGVAGNTFAASTPHLLTAVSMSQRNWATAIGDYWGNAANRRAYSGDIGEILVYNSLLGGADRQAVEQYLSYKWLGLTAPVPTNVLPTATALVVSNSAALDLNGISQAVGSLSGAGSVANGSAAWSTLTVGNDNTSTLFAGVISGSNALVKVGGGTLMLSGANTYSGSTFVGGGTLRLSGGANRLPAGGTVTVAAGATLDLNGQAQALAGIAGGGAVVGGSLTVSGTVAPGGVGTVGTLTLSSTPALSGTLLIDTRTSGDCDLLSVAANLDVSALALQITDQAQMSGISYVIATCAGDLTGSFMSTNLARSWSVQYDRTSGAGKVTLIHQLGTLISIY